MKLKELFEVAGEIGIYDDSTAMKLARDLYSGSGGDVEKARKMARGFFSKIDKKITAYDQMSKMRHVNRNSPITRS